MVKIDNNDLESESKDVSTDEAHKIDNVANETQGKDETSDETPISEVQEDKSAPSAKPSGKGYSSFKGEHPDCFIKDIVAY